jgi:three-Cys-motif partner protein
VSGSGPEDLFLFPADDYQAARPSRRVRTSLSKNDATAVREFGGGWTLSKLRVLELYFKRYRTVAGNGTYIDGFAGSGSVKVKGDEKVLEGSARIAINSRAFKDLWFFENDDTTLARLDWTMRYYVPLKRRRRVHVIPGDFNAKIVELVQSGQIPKDRPCFAFLDPDSTQLAWDSVALLARYKEPVTPPKHCKVELWILFNSHQALGRLIDRRGDPDYQRSARATTMDRVMGSRAAWWDLFQQGAHINAYAHRYAGRLVEDLGYGFAHAQLIRDPDSAAPQYFMIHASDHEAAWSFMRWAKQQSNAFDNTRPLPGLESPGRHRGDRQV